MTWPSPHNDRHGLTPHNQNSNVQVANNTQRASWMITINWPTWIVHKLWAPIARTDEIKVCLRRTRANRRDLCSPCIVAIKTKRDSRPWCFCTDVNSIVRGLCWQTHWHRNSHAHTHTHTLSCTPINRHTDTVGRARIRGNRCKNIHTPPLDLFENGAQFTSTHTRAKWICETDEWSNPRTKICRVDKTEWAPNE